MMTMRGRPFGERRERFTTACAEGRNLSAAGRGTLQQKKLRKTESVNAARRVRVDMFIERSLSPFQRVTPSSTDRAVSGLFSRQKIPTQFRASISM
jgi:hypothetical protein